MRCPECSTDNPESARFCMNCAATLVLVCAECGSELPLDAEFCDSCAAPVGSAPREAALSPQAAIERLERLVPKEYAERLLATRGQVTKERRIVTILFCDVKGSTAMAEKLDPEDWTDIMEGAFDVLIEPVYRYEGTLVRLMGDAVLAFFGAPIAHEDDPERACRAALEIIKGAQRYAARLEQERGIPGFNVRVGINTGLVVVGEVGSDLRVEYTAMGDAVNLAARMESAAEPGSVLITEDTHKLIAGLFETEALGSVQVKGKAEPVSVFRVRAAREVPGKVRGITGLVSPLVGREPELRALREALERLQAGVGGIVTIVGEAGIGKSRLVTETRSVALGRTDRQSVLRWVEGRCLSYGTSIAYLLWLDVIRSLVGITREASPQSVRRVLSECVEALCSGRHPQVYPYVAWLLSVPLSAEHETAIRNLDAERLQAATFAAVETLLGCAAAACPLVVVCEDLHWADPTSLDLLERLLALTRRVPLLLICVFRLQPGHPASRIRQMAARRYADSHSDLCVDPLSSNQGQQLIGNLIGMEALPEALAQRILARAEGNPFYVEEIIRSLLSSGALAHDPVTGQWRAIGQVAQIPIPETLNGVLMARIDGLQEDAKRVLQMASVIGRIFLYRLLEAIVAQPAELDRHLVSLQGEDMIRERAWLPELEYIFKHELTREAAYNSLLKKTRRAVHRKAAQALERLFPDRLEQQLGLLAHHWERAEDTRKAREYLLRAGDQARLAYAHQEAIDFYQRARRVLEHADGGSHEQWLALEEGLGDVYAVLAEHDVALAYYERARGLLAGDSDSPERLAALCRKTAMLHERKGEYAAAFQWLEQGLGALQGGLTLETARIRLAGAGVHSRQGQHCQALQWCQSGMEIARDLGGRKELAHATYLLGTIHGHLGDGAQEIACARDSLTLYEEIGDLVGQANALNNLGIACKESGDWAAAVGHFQRALELEQQLGNVHGVAKLTNNLGNVQLQRGQLDAAAHAYQESLDLWERTEFPVGVALSQSNLGKVCAERGQWQQALEYLERSQRGFQAIQSNHFLPEVYRRMAAVRLGLGQLDKARDAAERSVALAHDLGMELEKGISLRVMGEVRLALGELEQAHQALTASLDIVQAQGNRFRTGETLWQLGRLYRGMARAGDGSAAEQARAAFDRARAIFEQLGAERHLAQLQGGES